MFHHHHQSHNVDSNNDKYLTPIRDVDENEMEFDDDDDGDENERNDQNDQYADFVHQDDVDASFYTQPSFHDLLSQFGLPTNFTQLVQLSQQQPNIQTPIPSKKS